MMKRCMGAVFCAGSLLVVGSTFAAKKGSSCDMSEAVLSAQACNQIAAMHREKASWTPVQRKIDSKLLLKMKRRLNRSIVADVPEMRSSVAIDSSGFVLVDIKAMVCDDLLSRIQQMDGRIVSSFARYNAIRAYVPIDQLEVLASEAFVKSIRPADRCVTHKINTSEGVVAHRADVARTTYGVDGSGVTVGVLSDSAESIALLQASGDLPSGVTVLPGQAGSGSSEGSAMMEIVYDIAPGASLYFATAFGGQSQFAQNILDLRAAGCDVIVDDVGYFAEPVFQDGIIAQAVEEVVADGAVYFSSAGNSGNLNDGESGVWEGDYVAAASTPSAILDPGDGAHDFGGGLNYNIITEDSPSYFVLQWADPMGASGNDYDLYLMDSTLSTVIDGSINPQTGAEDPYESINSFGDDDAGNRLVIVKYSGEPRYLHLTTNRGRLSNGTAGQTSGHSSATAAFSVAAVSAAGMTGAFSASKPVENFSSDGPRRVFFMADGTPITPGNFSSTGGELRMKPDIAAADGVRCATPGFNPFYGTSAAAPHAAAIAALMIEGGLTTPAQIRTAMINSIWDIEAPGYDRDSGYGIVDASIAVGYSAEDPVTNATVLIVGNMVSIDFEGAINRTFKLQASPRLVSPAWVDVTTITLDASGQASFSEAITNSPAVFYRTQSL